MIVQVFTLADKVTAAGAGGRFDIEGIGTFGWSAEKFPAKLSFQFFALLRREGNERIPECDFRFTLLDLDGKTVDDHNAMSRDAMFSPGDRFIATYGKLALYFPAPGSYTLKLINNEGIEVYSYEIVIRGTDISRD